MDQHTPESSPPLELPKPAGDTQPGMVEQFELKNDQELSGSQQAERPSYTPAAPPALPPVPVGQQAPSAGQQAADPSAWTMPPIADDSDLIEKEWVSKAKEIVEKTRNDPYIQSKEMNKVKAEYMKKRFNKDLRLDQE